MFEELFFPRTAERYRAAPLVEQRERYLVYLRETGARRWTLRKCANDQLSLVRLLNLKEGGGVRLSQIEAVTAVWSQPKARRCDWSASPKARTHFVNHAVRWLRFLGWLDAPEQEHHPHHAKVTIFEEWLRQERGLSTATVQDYCRAIDHFFFWLAGKGTPLDAVQMADIDDAVAAEHRRGAWGRRTLHDYAQRLRPFFLFAEARGWCRAGLAAGIMAPRFMADETVPKGLRREDVLRLLASVQEDRPVDKRDRAILTLFIAYGLRAGEVGGLQLDDLDWENGMLRVRCPKPGRTHLWPLSHEVGHAILRYIREARPSGFGRSNEAAQKRSQKEQDGSEIRSVELERLIAEGLTLIERRNSMEFFRDQAAEQFERHTGSSWRPRTGSMVNHRALTAAMIDSRDFIAAKRRSEAEVLLPAGPKIAFTGGLEFNDHRAVWDRLDKVHAKHPDMVLLHGGSPKGAERIAACWANNRKVPQIVFKPDWTRHAKAAPFKRNDQILAVLPIGVIVFPGSGISANLADKARKLGIPAWKFGDEPALVKAGGGA